MHAIADGGAQKGVTFSRTIATRADVDPKGAIACQAAMIVWGDGVTTRGRITTRAGGGFAVVGTSERSALAVIATIQDSPCLTVQRHRMGYSVD